MNKLYIYDFIFSSIIAGINVYLITNFKYKILTILIWTFVILSSMLLNYNQILYFISLFIIGACIVTIYILQMIPQIKEFYIIFWLLYFISTIVILSIIITKKFMFNNINNQPIPGVKGDLGIIGNSGISYKLDKYPDKCYNELISTIEQYLTYNKKINNIDINNKYTDENLKNLYLKNLIKRICMSEDFGNYIYSDANSLECEYRDGENRGATGGRYIKGTDTLCNQSTTQTISSQQLSLKETKYIKIITY